MTFTCKTQEPLFIACGRLSRQLRLNGLNNVFIPRSLLYVRMNAASPLKIYAATLKAKLSNEMSKVSSIASKRSVACHTRPTHPDLGGQTTATAGH